MKHFQKFLLMMMCVAMLANITGCGNNMADDNAATNSATESENKDISNEADDSHRGGVVEDIGDDIQDGIDDVENAVDGKDEGNQ